jgi:hypothetical protein
MCMDTAYQQCILLRLVHDFNSFNDTLAVPNSCLLSRMFKAYAEVRLLVIEFRYSLCLMVIGLPDCPTQALLIVLNMSWYVSLGLTSLDYCESCGYIVLMGRKPTFKMVHLKNGDLMYCGTVICKVDTFLIALCEQDLCCSFF